MQIQNIMETLYRKYRPIDFDTVVGQDAIVKTLKNQIANGTVAHAYLFRKFCLGEAQRLALL